MVLIRLMPVVAEQVEAAAEQVEAVEVQVGLALALWHKRLLTEARQTALSNSNSKRRVV